MTYNKFEDLMNRSIDGLLSHEEQAELDGYLKKNPDAEKQLEKLQKAAGFLRQTPAVEPPPEIKREILAAIRSAPSISVKQEGIFERTLNALRSRRNWRYGYVFSFGIVFGILILAVSSDVDEKAPALDPLQAVGTMMTQSMTDTNLLDSKMFSVGEVEGTLSARAFGEYLILEIGILSGNKADIDISFDSDVLSFAGLWKPETFKGSFKIVDNHLILSQQGTANHSLLFLNKLQKESYLVFEIKSGDNSLQEKLLAFVPEG